MNAAKPDHQPISRSRVVSTSDLLTAMANSRIPLRTYATGAQVCTRSTRAALTVSLYLIFQTPLVRVNVNRVRIPRGRDVSIVGRCGTYACTVPHALTRYVRSIWCPLADVGLAIYSPCSKYTYVRACFVYAAARVPCTVDVI